MSEPALNTDEALRALIASSPFHQLLPIEILHLDRTAGEARFRLAFKAEFERQPGSGRHHGGVIATLIDVSGAFTMIAMTGRNVPTTSLTIDYLRPALPSSELLSLARVRQVGNTIGVVDIEVIDAETRLVALGRVSLSTAQPRR